MKVALALHFNDLGNGGALVNGSVRVFVNDTAVHKGAMVLQSRFTLIPCTMPADVRGKWHGHFKSLLGNANSDVVADLGQEGNLVKGTVGFARPDAMATGGFAIESGDAIGSVSSDGAFILCVNAPFGLVTMEGTMTGSESGLQGEMHGAMSVDFDDGDVDFGEFDLARDA